MNEIIDLKKVYDEEALYYWTNCLGETNLPGDGRGHCVMHTPEELPANALAAYNQAEFNSGLHSYVVSYRGQIGFMIGVLVDESWISDILGRDDVDDVLKAAGEALPELAGKVSSAIENGIHVPRAMYTVFAGKNTDPDGHEIMIYVGQKHPEYYKSILHMLNNRVYAMLRREIRKINEKLEEKKHENF